VDRPTGDLIGVVVNPRALRGPCAALWDEALASLRRTRAVECLHTVGDGDDGSRIAALIERLRPAVVVASGGDGTVRDVVSVLHGIEPTTAPALAILPLGTANNVARSLGLLSLRQHGRAAVEGACAAIVGGNERRIDIGRAGAHVFIGSFAVGMDGAILAARNDWRARWRLGNAIGGYPLYLLSCAVNLTRHRAAPGRVRADGTLYEGPVYNLLAANTALYAGEFRFDADDHSDDGRLDLQIFSSATDYVRAFVAAWRRHLRHQRGGTVAAPARIRRVTRIEIELARPVASQLDGEQDAHAAHYEIEVLPQAIRICVPPGTAGGPPAS